jgi:hypothetical protein
MNKLAILPTPLVCLQKVADGVALASLLNLAWVSAFLGVATGRPFLQQHEPCIHAHPPHTHAASETVPAPTEARQALQSSSRTGAHQCIGGGSLCICISYGSVSASGQRPHRRTIAFQHSGTQSLPVQALRGYNCTLSIYLLIYSPASVYLLPADVPS